MKAETAAYFEKAQEFLRKAASMRDAGWPDEAARAAYPAGFHAAQAYIFERTGKTAKSHAGVHHLFADIAKGDERFDGEQRTFLSRAYNAKAVADYESPFGNGFSTSPAS